MKSDNKSKGGKGKIVGIAVAAFIVIAAIFGGGGESGTDEKVNSETERQAQKDDGQQNATESDKKLLEGVIKNARGNDPALYTEQTYAILETTLEAAQAVVDDESATQEQIDAAIQLVADAVSGLEEVREEL